MPTKYFLYLLCCMSLLTGCKHYGVLVKRESELNCPTDIRKTVPWCAGEDAIFCCPTGPNEQFHGHKPTCWRLWQTSGEEWRDLHCEPLGSQNEASSQNKSGKPEVFPGKPVTPPIEILKPTKAVPDMPLLESESQEASPSDNSPITNEEMQEQTRPDGDDESLPEPNEDLLQLDTPVSQVSPLLPWEEVHESSSADSLTDYFQNANNESKKKTIQVREPAARGFVKSKPIRLPESVPRTQATTKKQPKPERPVLLPPVKEASQSASPKGNRTMTKLGRSHTLLRIVPADPLESLTGELAVKPVAHFGKRPEHFTSSENQDSAPEEKPKTAASPCQNQLAIVSPNATTKSQAKELIRISTLSPPKQSTHVRGSRSPALIFVR